MFPFFQAVTNVSLELRKQDIPPTREKVREVLFTIKDQPAPSVQDAKFLEKLIGRLNQGDFDSILR